MQVKRREGRVRQVKRNDRRLVLVDDLDSLETVFINSPMAEQLGDSRSGTTNWSNGYPVTWFH